MKLFIEKSKTDVYREGNWIYMVKSTGNVCPVKILQRYLDLILIIEKSDKCVFRAIPKTNTVENLRNEISPSDIQRLANFCQINSSISG